MSLLLSKVRPGDVLVADGAWPSGDPIEKGTRGNVAMEGSHLVWRSPGTPLRFPRYVL